MGYRDTAMPEETKNAALSGEWKLVPMAQLKKWHRDMDACQKVMWLRGGFDPAYCMDAQGCLKEMEGVLAASVPPTGGEVEIEAYMWQHDETGRIGFVEEQQIEWGFEKNNPRLQVICPLVRLSHVTRLQAEIAALQQRLNVADQLVDELEAELAKTRELLTTGRSVVRGSEYKVNGGIAWLYGVENFLAHQSAPAVQALSMENQRVVPPEPPIAEPHPLEISMGPGARSGSVQSAPAAKGDPECTDGGKCGIGGFCNGCEQVKP
jgi:hypothetical protein